ncbi:MAG: hypothetical protein ACLTEH_01450 [Clostridia bacterium]
MKKKRKTNQVIFISMIISAIILVIGIMSVICFPQMQTVFKTVYEAKDFRNRSYDK